MAYNNYQQKEKIKFPTPPKDNLIKYVKGEDYTKALNYAEVFGKYLENNGFSTNKLRGVFGEIDNISYKTDAEEMKQRIALLKPKLAYLTGRENKWNRDVVDNFKTVLEIMIDVILQSDGNETIKRYKNFTNFVKAVVSYHKYNGGN